MTDLSGTWTGSYAYPGSLDPVPFTADLRDDGGRISGLVHECDWALGSSAEQSATLAGLHDGASVTFTKIYDSHDQLVEPIEYRGDLDADACEISGTWTIVGEWSGPFVMVRPKAGSIDVALTVSETV